MHVELITEDDVGSLENVHVSYLIKGFQVFVCKPVQKTDIRREQKGVILMRRTAIPQ